MRLQHDRTLRDYFAAAEETTRDLLDGGSAYLAAIEKAYAFFTDTLWADEPDLRPVPASLSLKAFADFLGALRMAFSGHEAAVYPLLRTALESASYAFIMLDDAKLDDVWLERHHSDASRKASRKAFGQAVALTAAAIRRQDPTHAGLIVEAYEAVIDFGAHPNAKSVLHHLTFLDAEGDAAFEQMRLTMLYGPDAPQTERALIACLDFALAIGIILAYGLPKKSAAISTALQEISDAKNALAEGFGSED